jgi:hypothetical protein
MLRINDGDERMKIFHRDLTDDDFTIINEITKRMFGWQMWGASKGTDIDTNLASN